MQFYIYKAIPVIAEEMIHKNTMLHIQGNIHYSQGNDEKESLVIICRIWLFHHSSKQHKESQIIMAIPITI
jgi:hypothetical protein